MDRADGLNCHSSCVIDMWARPLLGPYVSDPMHLQLSNSYVGIFVGVNYEGREGVKILLVTTDWMSVGGGESCMQVKLTPLKNDILNVATRFVATGEPPRSKSFTCVPDHQLLQRCSTYPVPTNAVIMHLGF